VDTDIAGHDAGFGMTLLPDGKIIGTGYTTMSGGAIKPAFMRYTTTGALDATFNTTGYLTNSFGLSGANSISNVVMQPDGKVISILTYSNKPAIIRVWP
jgi:hypothetical protein